MEGRANDTADPGGLGVELLRQLRLGEGGGPSVQRRHFAGGGKGELEEEIEVYEDRTDLDPYGFYVGRVKGIHFSDLDHVPPLPCDSIQSAGLMHVEVRRWRLSIQFSVKPRVDHISDCFLTTRD